MNYVIDPSVAFKWAIAETDSAKAITLRDDFRKGIHQLVAPDLFPTEIANSLLVAERRGRIQPDDWPVFFNDVMRYCPILQPAVPHLVRSYEIATLSTPGVAADGTQADPQAIEQRVARAAIWLTPKSVKGFNADDFAELGLDRPRELQVAVRDFLDVAQQVPPNAPATPEQLGNAS
jgi:hypothetical protein